MRNDPLDIRAICDEGAHLDHMLGGVERVVVDQIKLIHVDIKAVSQWCRSAKIKNLGSVHLLQKHLLAKTHLIRNVLEEKSVNQFFR